ncbi:MAG: PfkB family carbohydrate kinase, partial [Bacteroidota bacterium]
DNAKNILMDEMRKRSIVTRYIITSNKKPTTQKVRIIAHSQQLIRVDYEKREEDKKTQNTILTIIKKEIGGVDAVIVSDYSKGILNKEVIKEAIKLANTNNKIIVIDPKQKDCEPYKNATLITPNNKEAALMINQEPKNDDASINKIGKELMEKTKSNILITRGEKGMSLFEKNGKITHIPTKAKEVYDVTGAGDTVVAAAALALTSGATMKEAAEIANHAAGITVGKVGTTTVSVEELKKDLTST